MLINSISIKNFQSYYDTQVLTFGRGLNLIVGNGGKGKSKLFNAFYWVLFGKIYITDIGWCLTETLPVSSGFAMQKYQYFNSKALADAQENEQVLVSVEIEIEDDNSYRYVIERSVVAQRLSGDNWNNVNSWSIQPSILKVSFDTKTGTKVIVDLQAEDKIAALFPEGIRNYIWFQGEALESLINFRNKETLKRAVKHISYFPFYEKLSDIISKSKIKIAAIESKKLRDLNKHNSDIKSLLSKIDTLNYKIENEEANKKKLSEGIDRIKIALAEGENKISGLASFTSLVKRSDECDSQIQHLNSEISRIDTFQREKLPSLWVLRGAEKLIQECHDIIEKHKEVEYTVPERKYLDNPSREKLEEILRDGRCFVCGTKFSEEDAPYHYIQERLRLQDEYLKEMEEYTSNMQFSKQFNMFVGKIQDYPSSLMVSLSSIDKQWKDSEDELEKKMAVRRRKHQDKEKINEEIDEVKRKYGVDPVKQAQSAGIINNGIRASRSLLDSEKRKFEASSKALSQYKRDLNEAEKELQKLGSQNSGITHVAESEWKDISTFLEDVCKRVQENARKELLRKIEDRANAFYSKFTEHDPGYKGSVKIGDDYNIEFDAALNTSHENRKKMSIINALLALNQEAMNIYYPFISDAPTSTFDIITTHKYLLGIKDIFGQSIIMTKDVDLNSKMYSDLIGQANVSRVYSLESELYSPQEDELKLNEVSTKVIPLK